MANASMRDVADRAGVSVNAVSLALRGDPSIPAATRERIRRAAGEVDYRRNPLVSALMADRAMKREPKSSGLTLGFMTFNKTRDDWRSYASPRQYFEGASQRATELGYRLDPFWLADPEVPVQRMQLMLRTRNVQGLLFAPPPDSYVQDAIDCAPFACVGLELHTALPAVHRVIPDHKHAVVETLRQLGHRGYRRVGLAIRRYADERAALNWSATFQAYHAHMGMRPRIPPLRLEDRDASAPANRIAFCQWIEKYRPDAIVALDPVVRTWLEALDRRIPGDVGLSFLEVTDRTPGASGIDRGSERIGAAAIDLLITMLHLNQRGVPAHDNALLIKGTWVEGATTATRERTRSPSTPTRPPSPSTRRDTRRTSRG